MSREAGLSRRALAFVSCTVGMPLCAYALPGVHVEPIYMSVFLGMVLGAFFLLVRPIVKLLTLPVGCLTLGLFSLVIDATAIFIMSEYIPGFRLDGPEWALAIAAILTVLRCPALR